MGILFDEQKRIFKLDTPASSYVMAVADKDKFLGHVYYGKKIEDEDACYFLRADDYPFTPEKMERERVPFMGGFPFEFSGHGCGDFRSSCIEIRTANGYTTVNPVYVSHRIVQGKPVLDGMPVTSGIPAVFASEKECSTLEIILEDKPSSVEIHLFYTVFEKLDVIVKSSCVHNTGKESLFLTKFLSSSLTFENEPALDVLTLHGAWARERNIQRRPISYGSYKIESRRGETSHLVNPFMAILERNADQRQGNVYGVSLVYSGNFVMEAELDSTDSVRVTAGIGTDNFCWKLEGGASFSAPEAVLVFSADGIGGMSRTYHDLFRNHLIRSKYKFQDRPVLLNSWEAAYFDFDTDKLLDIAREAAARGVELFVLDDGWFGKRNDDNTSLGDWFVNEKKLPGGLVRLSEEVHKMGMKFGVWFEPEMVSPDSDLYRAHPDWVLSVPGRIRSLARNQLVLDYSRSEVCDFVYNMVSSVIRDAKIDYVKWDMNRALCEVSSASLPPDRQGEVLHRYVLGMYRLQGRLVTDFPDLLLENCSAGGARFDPAMIYFSPQIWCSDDTDAIERLAVQEGTAVVYPLSCMGAHVSVCPNHITRRTTPFETRAMVALAGTFGYELDITKLSDEDKNAVPHQIKLYQRFGSLMREGDYYRLLSYAENRRWDSWQVVSKDKKQSLVTVIQVITEPSRRSRRLRFEGLDPQKRYRVEVVNISGAELNEGAAADAAYLQERIFSGSTLMNAGILVHRTPGDFAGAMYYITAE
ncbi:MAG: alpha-galactosidase [Spirochaetaceae bacterium]|nr:alpha-galactosidase [Spirochaetaceae bacterium]